MTGRRYLERRELLGQVVGPGAGWLVPAHHVGGAEDLFNAAQAKGLEGIVAKRVDSVYVPGSRSPWWRKVKARPRQEFVIGGWQPGEGGRSDPYPSELAYARTAAETPHLVLSRTLTEARWPTARIVQDIDEIRALRQQPGKAVYVVGGAGLLNSLVPAGLIDELHLIVHPVVVGEGTALFGGISGRQAFDLVSAEAMSSGRVHLTYRPTGS